MLDVIGDLEGVRAVTEARSLVISSNLSNLKESWLVGLSFTQRSGQEILRVYDLSR